MMRPTSTVFYGFLVIVIGIILIVFHTHAELLNWVVILAGISLIVPCLYTLISTVSGERRQRRNNVAADTLGYRFMSFGVVLTSVIGIALGIWLIVNPAFFIGFLAYAFAVVLILYGLYHLCVILWLCRPAKLPAYFYIIPLLLIIGGVVILCTSVRQIQSTVILITGIGLIGAGLSSFFEYIATSSIAASTKHSTESKN